MTARPTVVVTRRLPSAVEEELSRDFEVRLNRDDSPLGPAGLQDALRTADALLCTVTDRLTAEVLGGAEPLRARLLANFGVGFNHIDTEAAKARGLAVSNTPDVLTEATADIAMTLLLMVSRRAGEGERHIRSGAWTGWRPTHMLGSQVSGKMLGLVGMHAEDAHHPWANFVTMQILVALFIMILFAILRPRMSELHSDCLIWTTDAHFRVYRRHGRQIIPVLSP